MTIDSLEIRERFLAFYAARDHRRIASAPLIPNDPTLLLNVAGMVPFKPYFLGDAEPPAPRVVSWQKCVRTVDIDNVGRTSRHLTFFEMLGNFSFGDYFKPQAIRWAWELSTEVFGLDPERIWATVYTDDDEAEALWRSETDVPAERIQRLGADENYWWTHNAGPGGPCSELFYDRGPEHGQGGGPAVDDERYLEFYNLVFMQHELADDGSILGDLPAANIDTGLGLERLAVLLQDVPDVFHTDVFTPLLQRAGELTGTSYGADEDADLSLRVLAEHARTSALLIADGVLPSKEGRGYVLRRLLRRAVRHAHLLGVDAAGEAGAVVPMLEQVITTMGPAYPELSAQRELITRVARAEAGEFGRRVAQGVERLRGVVADVEAAGGELVPGDVAFELHDTYGFPVELTLEIAQDAGLRLDAERFDELMRAQRERARAAARGGGGGISPETHRQAAAAVDGAVEFLGYDRLESESDLAALVVAGGLLDTASEGDEVEVVLSRTPFYAEGGGQVGDHGVISTPTGRLRVTDTQTPLDGLVTHRAVVEAGEVAPGQLVLASVDADRRVATARSHSATHVLHATIREVLGEHAQQAGSLVQPGRLRFDFPHFSAVSVAELVGIERLVNERVLADPHVVTEIMELDAARAAGAIANFGDTYGQVVRVVTIGGFSKELCGGTHVPTGATIGTVHVVREESIGANTRRVEALTGADAWRYASREITVAQEAARLLDAPTDELVERITALTQRLRSVERELEQARAATLSATARDLAEQADRHDGVAVVVAEVDVAGADELRRLAAETRGNLPAPAAVVLGTATADGAAQLVGAVSDDLVGRGVAARELVHPAARTVGGGAGGKGDLAQAGGREGQRLGEALEVARRTLGELLA